MITTILSVLVIAAFAIVAIAGFLNWESNPFVPSRRTARSWAWQASPSPNGSCSSGRAWPSAYGCTPATSRCPPSPERSRTRRSSPRPRSSPCRSSWPSTSCRPWPASAPSVLGLVGYQRRQCGVRGCGHHLLGRRVRHLLRHRRGPGSVFDLQHIHSLGIARVLRPGRGPSGAARPWSRSTRSTACRTSPSSPWRSST